MQKTTKFLLLTIIIILITSLYLFWFTSQEQTILLPKLTEKAIELVDEDVFFTSDTSIYKYPSTDFDSISEINGLESVHRIGILTNGWSQIMFNNEIAYVLSENIVVETPATLTETNQKMYILPEQATIHAIDGLHESIDTLTIATKVTQIGVLSNNVWSKISYNDIEAYILTENLSIERPVIYTLVNETQYASKSLSIYDTYKDTKIEIGKLNWADDIKRIAIGDNGWSKVIYKEQEAFIETDLLVDSIYPIKYSDSTATITITKEWYGNAWCYIAHLKFSDYDRLGTSCANGKYNKGNETTSHAAKRLNAIFCVNGCYSAPYLSYPVARDGICWNNKTCWNPAVYNKNNGKLLCGWETNGTPGIAGVNLGYLVKSGKVTDTFNFGPPILNHGKILVSGGGGRAQRTFIGSNGKPGDIWIIVSDGRKNDGESSGLTGYQCAKLLKDKGCTFGVPLDGGGSSTMYFNGKVLNAAEGNERAVVDFVYFK